MNNHIHSNGVSRTFIDGLKMRGQHPGWLWGVVVLASVIGNSVAGQVRPVEGLHQHTPRVYALTHATIHLEPGKTIRDGTILLREGLIEAAGRQVSIPAEAQVIPLNGKTVYPGFIESYWEVVPSGQGGRSAAASKDDQTAIVHHWNQRVRPSRSVLSELEADSNEIAKLRQLGFTTAHLVPGRGIFR
ncbi:MAG: hypothetical protein JSW54_03150, partial [Fidelibacterota bacterium]